MKNIAKYALLFSSNFSFLRGLFYAAGEFSIRPTYTVRSRLAFRVKPRSHRARRVASHRVDARRRDHIWPICK